MVGALIVGTSIFPVASAASDADECADAGGVYENDRGTKSCIITETPGNNQGGVTKTDEDSQKGSFSSSHELEEEDCVRNHGGDHC